LREELVCPFYTFREERILLEKKDDMKKRGLSSPDVTDALAFLYLSGKRGGVAEH
jgi:hypothetical protein